VLGESVKDSRKIQQGSSGQSFSAKERKTKTSGEEVSERKTAEERKEEKGSFQVHSIDQLRFLANYPPTPPLTQHYHLFLT